jgi:hypothetical protein
MMLIPGYTNICTFSFGGKSYTLAYRFLSDAVSVVSLMLVEGPTNVAQPSVVYPGALYTLELDSRKDPKALILQEVADLNTFLSDMGGTPQPEPTEWLDRMGYWFKKIVVEIVNGKPVARVVE